MNLDPGTLIILFAVLACVGAFHTLVSKSRRVGVFWFIVCIMLLIACLAVIFSGGN